MLLKGSIFLGHSYMKPIKLAVFLTCVSLLCLQLFTQGAFSLKPCLLKAGLEAISGACCTRDFCCCSSALSGVS